MNKTLIALLLIFIGSVLVPAQAGESKAPEWCALGGDGYHCSHHPINLMVIIRLECVDARCETKKDSKTGDIFVYAEIQFEGQESEMGYQHVHDQ